MDIIKHLLGYLVRAAVALFLIALVWWLVTLLMPSLRVSFSQGENKKNFFSDLLPSPRKFQNGLLGTFKNPEDSIKIYEFNPQEPAINYINYTNSDGAGLTTISSSPGKSNITETPSPWKSYAIRNLSIYQGGHVYTGLSFTGEARKEMFRNGKFPIVVADAKGAVVGVSNAQAVRDGKIGYYVFETKINYVLPNGAPCTMVFEEGRAQGEQGQPFRIAIPITCN